MNITIYLPPITKKNSQQIIKVRGRLMIIPSKKYKEFEKACESFIPKRKEPFDYPVNVKCVYFMPTHRKVDLVNLQEATLDVLVRYGILADDNASIVFSMDGSYVDYDKDNPRTEITITAIKVKEDRQLEGQLSFGGVDGSD